MATEIHELVTTDKAYEDLQRQLDPDNDKGGLLSNQQLLDIYNIRVHNIKLFKQMYPEFKNFNSVQILSIFRLYKENCRRTYGVSNISF